MLFRRPSPAPHPPFAALPATQLCVGPGERMLAINVRGTLASPLLPVVCIPGYHRNMTDYAVFASQLVAANQDRPVVLLDLAGRGRSAPLRKAADYSSLVDMEDVLAVIDALGIFRAVFVGQGHGGQVIMAMAAQRPGAIAGAVLIDAGPVSDSRGLVRLRNNLRHIEGLGSARLAREAMRRVLATDYPSADEAMLDMLAQRVFRFDLRNRVTPLYDRKLIARLDGFDFDDIFEPQWPLFDALASAELMLMRTQLTDLLRRETFEEMARRREDAVTLTIAGQGSPALLDGADTTKAVVDFLARMEEGRH